MGGRDIDEGRRTGNKKRNREGSPLTINALRLESVSDTNGEFVKRVQLRAVNPGMVIHNPDSGVFAHGVLYAGAETFGIAAVSTQAVVAFELVIGKTGGANEFPSAGAAELLEDQRINTVAADAGIVAGFVFFQAGIVKASKPKRSVLPPITPDKDQSLELMLWLESVSTSA